MPQIWWKLIMGNRTKSCFLFFSPRGRHSSSLLPPPYWRSNFCKTKRQSVWLLWKLGWRTWLSVSSPLSEKQICSSTGRRSTFRWDFILILFLLSGESVYLLLPDDIIHEEVWLQRDRLITSYKNKERIITFQFLLHSELYWSADQMSRRGVSVIKNLLNSDLRSAEK